MCNPLKRLIECLYGPPSGAVTAQTGQILGQYLDSVKYLTLAGLEVSA
jgi:hypothetical protein